MPKGHPVASEVVLDILKDIQASILTPKQIAFKNGVEERTVYSLRMQYFTVTYVMKDIPLLLPTELRKKVRLTRGGRYLAKK